MNSKDNPTPGGAIYRTDESNDPVFRNADLISQYLEQEYEGFYKTVCVLVWKRFGSGYDTKAIAAEIISELANIALSKAAEFDDSRNVGGWLYGIAGNLVKQRFDKVKRLNKREIPVSKIITVQEGRAEADFFDQFVTLAREDFAEGSALKLSFHSVYQKALLTLSSADREILKLALIKEMDGTEIALALNLKPGAARVRLHRALGRLREAMVAQGWSQEI